MSILRTYNLQNPDSATTNIELTANGGAVATGIVTATGGLNVGAGGTVITTTAGGNVGIGTTTTNSRSLSITGAGNAGTQVEIRGSFDAAGIAMFSARQFEIQSTASNEANYPSSFIVYDRNANGYRMVIDGSGRLRIPSQPAFLAYPSTTVNRSTGTFTWQFNTTVFNIGGHFNTSTYRFVAPVAGRYLFGANCRHDSANSDYFRTNFLVNGSNGSFQTVGHVIADIGTVWGPRYYSFSVTYLANLNVNDYVEVVSVANNDGAWTQNNESQFWGYLVG